ncbi:MAG: hypothetical protein MZW92_28385 [Comamonadaceae bacterium]|nr:hypothetical protein [Comamonadaceae bacterium]
MEVFVFLTSLESDVLIIVLAKVFRDTSKDCNVVRATGEHSTVFFATRPAATNLSIRVRMVFSEAKSTS